MATTRDPWSWLARTAVGVVCLWNMTAAVPFVSRPAEFAAGFEVGECGVGGEILVRGLGIAFLMWQVPFVPVVLQPRRNRVCFACLLAMQLIGLAGESLMMAALPAGHQALRTTGWRFVAFDGCGLALMALAYWALAKSRPATAAQA